MPIVLTVQPSVTPFQKFKLFYSSAPRLFRRSKASILGIHANQARSLFVLSAEIHVYVEGFWHDSGESRLRAHFWPRLENLVYQAESEQARAR